MQCVVGLEQASVTRHSLGDFALPQMGAPGVHELRGAFASRRIMKFASGGRVARIPVDAQRVSCTAHTDPGVSGASLAMRLEAKRARRRRGASVMRTR